jgi:hypothetical protein
MMEVGFENAARVDRAAVLGYFVGKSATDCKRLAPVELNVWVAEGLAREATDFLVIRLVRNRAARRSGVCGSERGEVVSADEVGPAPALVVGQPEPVGRADDVKPKGGWVGLH